MVEGGNEAATYEYGIELLHRNRPNQRIVRKFSSDFEVRLLLSCSQKFSLIPVVVLSHTVGVEHFQGVQSCDACMNNQLFYTNKVP
jgi:hypothetical protein